MKNFVQPGDVQPFTAPGGGVTSGTAYQIGQAIVVAVASAEATETFQGAIRGVFTLPKATGQTWDEGELLYWDDSAKKFTTTSSANRLAGWAQAEAASGDTEGSVYLDGAAR
jgi:predicted RecA/RadA family phage recombinase